MEAHGNIKAENSRSRLTKQEENKRERKGKITREKCIEKCVEFYDHLQTPYSTQLVILMSPPHLSFFLSLHVSFNFLTVKSHFLQLLFYIKSMEVFGGE
jgi:hypothetical protein